MCSNRIGNCSRHMFFEKRYSERNKKFAQRKVFRKYFAEKNCKQSAEHASPKCRCKADLPDHKYIFSYVFCVSWILTNRFFLARKRNLQEASLLSEELQFSFAVPFLQEHFLRAFAILFRDWIFLSSVLFDHAVEYIIVTFSTFR
jgi:hypothetical protein